MSLTALLFSSQKCSWNWQKQSREYQLLETPIVKLVQELEAECAKKGLKLCRWDQALRRNHEHEIRWGIVVGDRPARWDDYRVIFSIETGSEGTTERCKAYRKLLELRAYLETLR